MSTTNTTSFSKWNSFWGNQIKARQAAALNQWSNPLLGRSSDSVMGGMSTQGFMNPALMQLVPLLVMSALVQMAQQQSQSVTQGGQPQVIVLDKSQIGQGNTPSRALGTVDDGMKTFGAIDSNEDGKFDYAEYEQYYIRDKENLTGKTFDNPNSPELAKYRQEAKNLFSAISRGNETVSKNEFKKALVAFDRLDGKKDGNINTVMMAGIVNKIKENGKSTIISNGKTLSELM